MVRLKTKVKTDYGDIVAEYDLDSEAFSLVVNEGALDATELFMTIPPRQSKEFINFFLLCAAASSGKA